MLLYEAKKNDYFGAARREILELLPAFSTNVLEVGCGSGQTLEMLKQLKYCDRTVGIELFPTAAEEARGRANLVYCMDVEREDIPFEIGKFELILILDVLEHLVDPWSILQKIKKQFLAPNGKIIVSLPNAQHFTLVLPLLFGKLEYVERGIRDKTHLRFFTKSSGSELIQQANLKIEKTKATSLDARLNSGKLNLVTMGLFSQFLASQYIFLASNANAR